MAPTGESIGRHGRGAWFAEYVLPHEGAVRRWLARKGWSREESEDLIQDAYARLASADYMAITEPGAYLFRTIRNAMTDQLRRRQIVSIRSVADLSNLDVPDPQLGAEARMTAHEEMAQLKAAIEDLPASCRAVFVLRKVEGVSQAETAKRLGMSQSTVEKYVARGFRKVAQALTQAEDVPSSSAARERSRHAER